MRAVAPAPPPPYCWLPSSPWRSGQPSPRLRSRCPSIRARRRQARTCRTWAAPPSRCCRTATSTPRGHGGARAARSERAARGPGGRSNTSSRSASGSPRRAPTGARVFHYFVVKDTEINSFAVSGGWVFIFTGLILAAGPNRSWRPSWRTRPRTSPSTTSHAQCCAESQQSLATAAAMVGGDPAGRDRRRPRRQRHQGGIVAAQGLAAAGSRSTSRARTRRRPIASASAISPARASIPTPWRASSRPWAAARGWWRPTSRRC